MTRDDQVDTETATATVLRDAGAQFAFVHGSRAYPDEAHPRPDSDLDVAAFWGRAAPVVWEVPVPGVVDLLVLDDAPLWLAGRVAMHGRLLFVADAAADVLRVRWQVDTRMRWLDEIPAVRARYAQRRARLALTVTDG